MTVRRHTIYNIIGGIAPLIVSLLTVPAFLHLIGGERYGVLALAWLLFGYFSVFDLGFGKAATQRIAALRDAMPRERATTFWSALSVNLATGVVGGIALYIVGLFVLAGSVKSSAPIRAELVAALPILAVSFPLATASGVLGGALRGRERFLEINAIVTIVAVLSQVLPLATAWVVGPALGGLIFASAVASLIGVVLQAFVCNRRVTEGHGPRVSRSEIRKLLSFGGWVTVSAIIGPLMIVFDRFVIGAVLGAVAVTLYTIPWQLTQRLLLLPLSLQSALYPRQAAADEVEATRLGDAGIRSVMAVTTPIAAAAILFMEPFLRLWLGTKIDVPAAATVGRILVFGFWSTGIAYIPFGQIEARGRVRLAATVHIVELPIYLVLLAGLLHLFGIAGAALAFSIRCALDAAIFAQLAFDRRAPWVAFAFGAVVLAATIILTHVFSTGTIGWLAGAIALLMIALVQSYVIAPELVRRARFSRVRA